MQHRMAYQGQDFVDRYGQRAAESTPPISRIIASGVKVSAGTDATRVASYNPWVSLAWLVTGRTVGGTQLYPRRNCLNRETALRLWTENVTWFSNEEGKKGRIEVGQLADLIVPDRDYFSCAEGEIADIVSDLTIVGGRVVYGAGEFARHDEVALPPAMPDWSPVRAFARDISDAGSHFLSSQLPELYTTIERNENSFPVQISRSECAPGLGGGVGVRAAAGHPRCRARRAAGKIVCRSTAAALAARLNVARSSPRPSQIRYSVLARRR